MDVSYDGEGMRDGISTKASKPKATVPRFVTRYSVAPIVASYGLISFRNEEQVDYLVSKEHRKDETSSGSRSR